MEQSGAPDKSTDYPVEKELTAVAEPIELSFQSTESYGSNDMSSDVESPVSVLARGQVGQCAVLKEEWKTILPGVEGREEKWERRAGGGGYIEWKTTIRVAPEACPAVIRVIRSHDYEAWDYDSGGGNTYSSHRFAVRTSGEAKG
jgi:hypothetical protein